MGKASWYDDNVFVVKTENIDELKEFFEQFGLEFQLEKHGEGPQHYSCSKNGKVFELYPQKDLV